MLSFTDLERLIAVKRREIQNEKITLGLASTDAACKQNDVQATDKGTRTITFSENKQNISTPTPEKCDPKALYDIEETIPLELERYIRRYVGLPAMLKAGEYSPNNPQLRCALPSPRGTGQRDAFVGLGEYEERRRALRRLKQLEYKRYLDQQAKQKREERVERQRRQYESETFYRDARSPASVVGSSDTRTVEAGVQCERAPASAAPLSVAVQTDDELLTIPATGSLKLSQLTQAERELSPRTVAEAGAPDPDERPIKPASWLEANPRRSPSKEDAKLRRRSYGDFYENASTANKCRDKLMSDLRHTYMPSLFDAEAIHLRNLKAEQEAAERRQFYQQELKNQILEQQRIKEERKTREKMLEQAEMRRLEEQLRMLRAAQNHEADTHRRTTAQMIENTDQYNFRRASLQKDIDIEKQNLFRASSQPICNPKPSRAHVHTSKSDNFQNLPSNLPHFYPCATNERTQTAVKPLSQNIPDNSIFSPNYDVDTYLRKNLNPSKESLLSNLETDDLVKRNSKFATNLNSGAKIDDKTSDFDQEKRLYEPSFSNKIDTTDETLLIPVLRHSPKPPQELNDEKNALNVNSEAMKLVEDKWKIPAVQKNILKSFPNTEGKNVNILTQLGSIRRQLQLEQLKLDKMLSRDGAV